MIQCFFLFVYFLLTYIYLIFMGVRAPGMLRLQHNAHLSRMFSLYVLSVLYKLFVFTMVEECLLLCFISFSVKGIHVQVREPKH